ncbi:MAG: PAS domain-containing protein, partial [Thermodesulfobacteriota bacterium]
MPPLTIDEIIAHGRTILSSLAEPCCLLDPQCVIRYQNPASLAMWGDNVGRACRDVCQLRDTHCDDCPAALSLQDGRIRKTEKILRSQNQGERYVEVATTPLTSPEGDIIAILEIAHDTTDIKLQKKGQDRIIQELQATLSTVKRLSGLLPICGKCKKIKDSKGNW